MKKQHRIISLLLVISLLFGSLVFTVNADSGSRDAFVPTATLTDITPTSGTWLGNADAYVANGSDPDILTVSWTLSNQDFTAHRVLLPDGNTYFQLSAIKTGGTSTHTHITPYAKNNVTYDANTNNYVVYEMDIGTESAIQDFYISVIAREGGTSGTWMSSGNTNFSALLKVNPGEFKHVTIVKDFNNNMAYTFAGDELVSSYAFMTANGYSSFTNGTAACSGIRIQADASYVSNGVASTPLVENNSFLLDNLEITYYNSSSAGNLTDALANKSLATWTLKSTEKVPTVPAIASVDGVEYNNVPELNNALASGLVKEVVLLRDSATKFTVDCDAKITTNGFSTYKLASGATSVDNGDGTVTVSAEFTNALTRENFANNSISGGADYIAGTTGNNITSVGTGNNTSATYFTITKATPANGSPFLQAYCNTTTSYKGSNNNLFINASMSNSAPFTVIGDNLTAYYVVDFDVMTQGEMLPEFDVSVPMRRNSDKGGYPFSDEIFFDGLITDKNAWSHVTIVGDIANNVAKIYVNGVYVGDGGKAVRNDQTDENKLASDTQVVAQGFRIELARNGVQTDRVLGQNVAFDNLSHRLYINGNASLKSAIDSGDITAWDSYVDGMAGEKLPAIASVNGVLYRNTTELAPALASNDKLAIEFGTTPILPLTLRANSVVDTNGLDFDSLVTLDASATKESVDGNYVTVSCAFIESREVRDVNYTTQDLYEADVLKAIKGDAEGNLLNRFNPVSSAAWGSSWGNPGYRYGEIITNNFTGETIYHEFANMPDNLTPGDKSNIVGTNEYVNFFFNSQTLSYESGRNEYIVMDYDFALEGEIDGSMAFSLIPRNGGGRWASGVAIKSLPIPHDGTMVHITAVHDFTNNKAYYFFDGELGLTVNDGAINSTGYSEYKSGVTTITVNEYKLGSNSINTYDMDDMNIRWFDLATANDTLDDAIASGNIADWTDNIYVAGTHSQLPVFATVNGTEVYTTTGLEAAIAANPDCEVELLHSNTDTVNVTANAVINTNGLENGITVDSESIMTQNGNIIKIVASNSSSASTTNGSEIVSNIKYNANDNLLTSSVSLSTGVSGGSWGGVGSRQSAIITNKETGDVYYNESVNGGNLLAGNEYIQFSFTSTNLTYDASYNEYLILDYDIMVNAVSGTYVHSTNGTSTADSLPVMLRLAGPATTSFGSNGSFKNFNLVGGEFSHVTTVYSLNDGYAHVFVNGKLTYSYANGAFNSTGLTKYKGGETFSTINLRLAANSCDEFYLDNLYARHADNLVGTDTVAKAISTGYLAAWDGNIYDADYDMPSLPTIAVVNGERYTNEKKLASALVGRNELNVKFLSAPSEALTVTADAVIETNGFANTFTVGAGAGLISTVGTVSYIDGAFKESATYIQNGDGSAAATFDSLKGTNVPGNLLAASSGEGNFGSLDFYKYTACGSDDPYYLIRPKYDKTLTNDYITTSLTSTEITATSYFIVDVDVATETEFINQIGISVVQRSSATNKFGDSEVAPFGDYVTPSDKWAHVTIVGDIADNRQYIFVNGVYVPDTVRGSHYLAVGDNTDVSSHLAAGPFKANEVRVNIGANVAVDVNSTDLIDNLSVRYFSSNEAACDIEAAISAGTLENYALAEFGRMGEKLPAIATVDGIEYGNLYNANAALGGGEKITATLERDSIIGDVVIASTGTVEYNGMPYTVALGYLASEEGGVVTITLNEETGHVYIAINGATIYEGELRVGTDLNELLKSFGSYGTAVVAGNGNIFTNVTWETVPGYVTGDANYNGTGTKVETLYYAHQNGTPVGNLTYDEAGLTTLITTSGTGCSIILNESATLTSSNGINAEKNVYLNGNSISFTGGNHAMSASGSSSISFYGPGVINDMKSTNTQAFLFAGYGWTGKITLNNLTVNTSQALFQFRSGNAEINNCEIYANVGMDTSLFQIGEDYNTGYSTTPVTIDVIDSYINYRVSNTRTSDDLPIFRQKIVTQGTDPSHVINIVGSTLISEHSIFEACQYNSEQAAPTESNMTINVKDSTLVAATLADRKEAGSAREFFATLNFLDNVSVNSGIANLSDANITEGLEIVKSNDHLANVTYASEYATVTWANGTTEYWADGSIPVNEAIPFTKVCKVEAGKSYTFDQVYGEAPFALSASLTLGSSISFNLYIPASADLQSVTVNGVALTGVERNVNSVLCYGYTVELTPAEAASAFDVVFTLADDSVVTRTISVAQYASRVYDAYADDATVKMMSNTLKYIKSSARYFGINADVSAIDSLLSNHASTAEAIATTTTDTSALSAYISGAQLNVMSTLKFRFNLVSGVDGSDVQVTVNGEAKNVEVYGSYVEVALRAYEMGDMMTITVNGATGTFDLATYCNYVINNKGTTDATTRSYTALTNDDKGNLISAIYSYYVAASEYKN